MVVRVGSRQPGQWLLRALASTGGLALSVPKGARIMLSSHLSPSVVQTRPCLMVRSEDSITRTEESRETITCRRYLEPFNLDHNPGGNNDTAVEADEIR
jgi:hypothetical protein